MVICSLRRSQSLTKEVVLTIFAPNTRISFSLLICLYSFVSVTLAGKCLLAASALEVVGVRWPVVTTNSLTVTQKRCTDSREPRLVRASRQWSADEPSKFSEIVEGR